MPKMLWFSVEQLFPLSRALSISLSSLVLVLGCSDLSAPTETQGPVSQFGVSLSVTPLVVEATRTQGEGNDWVDFSVDLSIQNHSDGPLIIQYCAVSLERWELVRWRTVWEPICPAILLPPDSLAAGQTREQALYVSASLNEKGAPEWESSAIPGRYRVVARVGPGMILLPLPGPDFRVYSNEFIITKPVKWREPMF